MGIIEKIKEIGRRIGGSRELILVEAEMARTQKNKATEFHFGVMKARLAKLRSEVRCAPSLSSRSCWSRREAVEVQARGTDLTWLVWAMRVSLSLASLRWASRRC